MMTVMSNIIRCRIYNKKTMTIVARNYSGVGRPSALGSSLGSDTSMIAANDRQDHPKAHFDSSMIAANHRRKATTSNFLNSSSLMKLKSRSNQQYFFSTSSISTTSTNEGDDDVDDNNNNNDDDEMKDEYGDLKAEGKIFLERNYELEDGSILPEAQLCYQTYGKLNEETRDNVIVVCHALTGNASLHSWWGELLGEGKAFDTSKYLIVCCNILGSCYGSTSPQCLNPATGLPYGKDFPDVSVQDTVRLQLLLLQNELRIRSVKSVIGGSFGGMQAIEFAVQGGIDQGGDFVCDDGSPFVKSAIPIACGASHTAWQIAVSEVQRQAIYADPNWETDPVNATKGLSVARQMGMVSYRTPLGYQNKFGRELQQQQTEESSLKSYGSNVRFKTQSYLEYQGSKFLLRFDPVTYVKMTEQMDSHNIYRGRSEDTLQNVRIPVMVMGIDSDVLYPLQEQRDLVSSLPRGTLRIISSLDGHDGFLLEQEQVGNNIIEFLDTIQ